MFEAIPGDFYFSSHDVFLVALWFGDFHRQCTHLRDLAVEAVCVPRHGTGSLRRCLNPWRTNQPQEDKTHQPQGSSHAVTICSDFTRHYGIWGKRLVQVECCRSALALHHAPNQLATEVNADPRRHDDIVRAQIRCRSKYPNVGG